MGILAKKEVKCIMAAFAIVAVAIAILSQTSFLPSKPKTFDVNTLNDFQDETGGAFKADILNNNLVLIYFGFTRCPDICPSTLQSLSDALEKINPDRLPIISPVFISVDPDRDTPKVMRDYLSHFHPKFIGLSGEKARTLKIADSLRVFYQQVSGANTINHSSFIYAIAPHTKMVEIIDAQMTPSQLTDAINHLQEKNRHESL